MHANIRVDGDDLVVRSLRGEDRFLISELRDADGIGILLKNNHLAVELIGDRLLFHKHVRLTGTTATYSPTGQLILGLSTVQTDRSRFTLEAERILHEDRDRRAAMEWVEHSGDIVRSDIATSNETRRQSDNQVRVGYGEKNNIQTEFEITINHSSSFKLPFFSWRNILISN